MLPILAILGHILTLSVGFQGSWNDWRAYRLYEKVCGSCAQDTIDFGDLRLSWHLSQLNGQEEPLDQTISVKPHPTFPAVTNKKICGEFQRQIGDFNKPYQKNWPIGTSKVSPITGEASNTAIIQAAPIITVLFPNSDHISFIKVSYAHPKETATCLKHTVERPKSGELQTKGFGGLSASYARDFLWPRGARTLNQEYTLMKSEVFKGWGVSWLPVPSTLS